MMKKMFVTLIAMGACTLGIAGDLPVNETSKSIGFVNFKNCMDKSKLGMQEKNALESMKKQMTETLEKADKELTELSKNLENRDYLDTLSTKAEEELKQKFAAMSQEFAHYQNQYYQLLNQANYRMLQTLHSEVTKAAEKIRDKHQFSMIMGEDALFAVASSLDLTEEVISEMDKNFDLLNVDVASSNRE